MLRVGCCHFFKTGSDVEAAREQVSGELCVLRVCTLLPVCVRVSTHACKHYRFFLVITEWHPRSRHA